MFERPKRAKAPLTLISSEFVQPSDKILHIKVLFEDVNGYRWSSEHFPVFIFDLDYEGHKDD